MTRISVGLIGLGRLGRVYARDLSERLSLTRLVAVADTDGDLARRTATEFHVDKAYDSYEPLLSDPDVDAVVVASPTHTHRSICVAALEAGKATFCEKPPALTLDEAAQIADAERRTRTFFQLGFMRRFDLGYAAAKQQIEAGRIGRPVVFKSTSRDPFLPSLAFVNPKSSGGIFVDMGIHDFDLARWYMGEIEKVHAVGAVLAFPELAALGDFDNAIATLTFADGRLGVVDLTRNGCYGYDISTELLGTEGTIRIGYLRETPIVVMTKNSVSHDTVPYFMERFERAYTSQLANFAENILQGRPAPITIQDGLEALRVAIAASQSCASGRSVEVRTIT